MGSYCPCWVWVRLFRREGGSVCRLAVPSGQPYPSVLTGPVLSLFLFQGCEDSRPLTSKSGIHGPGLQMSPILDYGI